MFTSLPGVLSSTAGKSNPKCERKASMRRYGFFRIEPDGLFGIIRGMDFETLSGWANEELKSLTKVLPDDVRAAG